MPGLTIIDFGIARAFREGAAGDTAHFGTRCYAPPEQFGYGQTDERSDVYALGMLLYYLLAERDPSPSVAAAGFAGPEVPFALRPVLQRACAFDPAAPLPDGARPEGGVPRGARPSRGFSCRPGCRCDPGRRRGSGFPCGLGRDGGECRSSDR